MRSVLSIIGKHCANQYNDDITSWHLMLIKPGWSKMFWLDCGREYSNLSTFTRLTVDSISCFEFHTCEQVDQTSATWRSLSLEAPKIRSATRVGAFQECEMCPREASCLHQSLGSPKTCSSMLLTTWYLENRVVLQWQLYFVRLSWKRVNQLMSIFQLWSAHVSSTLWKIRKTYSNW